MFWFGFLVDVHFIGFGFTVGLGFLAGGVVGWFLILLTCGLEPLLLDSLASLCNVVDIACCLFLNMLFSALSSSYFTRRTPLGKAGQLTFPLDLHELGLVLYCGRIISSFSGRGMTPPLLMRLGVGGSDDGGSPDEQVGPLDPLLGGRGVLASEGFSSRTFEDGGSTMFSWDFSGVIGGEGEVIEQNLEVMGGGGHIICTVILCLGLVIFLATF